MGIKRYLAAFGSAAVAFAGVYGAAASLGVDGGVAQAGADNNLTCDSDGVTVLGYMVDTNEFPDARSSGVKVANVSNACDGQVLVARISNAAGEMLAIGDTTIPNNDSDVVTINWSNVDPQEIKIKDISSVQLTIG